MITRNNLDIGQIVSNAKRDFLTTLIVGNNYPASNVLHQYRTFNYRVTLAIISAEEKRTQSYKKTGFDYILFQSHGRNVDGTTPGGDATLNKIQSFVNMVGSGYKNNYDFYLEDLSIKSFMAAGRDWATSVKLKIIEPYSMDTFLTAIRTGLAVKGYYALDKDACFVLKIDFVGYREDSEEAEVVPYSTRYYPLAVTSLNASLSSQGTQYDLTARPLNDIAKLDDVNLFSESVKLTGKTVGEMVQSLEDALNNLGKSRNTDSNIVSHKYSIKFVNEKDKVVEADASSSVVTARIKATKMFDSLQDYGVREFSKDKTQYTLPKTIDKKTGDDNVEESVITLTADGRMGILTIIDSIIVDSYYVVDKIKKKFEGEYNKEDGQLDWWRIIPTIENGEWIPSMQRYQKIVTYHIVPRKVHYTKLTSIFVPSHVAPARDYDSMTARVYEWNYTGNNKDITSFNINFNQLWSRLITPNYGQKPETQGASNATKNDDGIVIKTDRTSNGGGYGNFTGLNTSKPVGVTSATTTWAVSSNSSKEDQLRSGSETNPLFDLARDAHNIINNPNEQIMLNLEILGDPMWLGTQFIDEGSTVGNSSKLYTVDGGIAIRTVDPVVRVLCYAPRDVNREGFIAPNEGESRVLSSYSAHYTIIEVESNFQNGVFKQKLKGNRNVQQDMAVLTSLENLNKGDRFTSQKIDLSIR
jgi:hypothetical protein